jgi:hypothetical protein
MGGTDIVVYGESRFFDKLDEELATMKLNSSVWNIGKLGTAFNQWPYLHCFDYKKDITIYSFPTKPLRGN